MLLVMFLALSKVLFLYILIKCNKIIEHKIHYIQIIINSKLYLSLEHNIKNNSILNSEIDRQVQLICSSRRIRDDLVRDAKLHENDM